MRPQEVESGLQEPEKSPWRAPQASEHTSPVRDRTWGRRAQGQSLGGSTWRQPPGAHVLTLHPRGVGRIRNPPGQGTVLFMDSIFTSRKHT